ncbi:MAG: alpha/beta hydrolase [Candidatus Rokubacteria bacterium]|nr:alpha/beta hydrolase [Candidatus Rokubacteria bacterium]
MTARGVTAVRAHLAKLAVPTSVAERRAQYERAERVFPVPPEVSVKRVQADGVPAEWLEPPAARDGVVLYLHGGGYVIGSPRSHRHLAAAIAGTARAPALLLEYRLAPEHPFPAAVEDAVAAYRWLLDRGVAPHRLAIAGDSAGGGLTVATLLALREQRLALPGAAVCLSPWVDLTCAGGSYTTKADSDPIVRREGVVEMARAYLGDTDPRTPLASPLFADLAGLPPLLIQVGSEEVLLDDAVGLAERARQAGVEVTLEIWPDMIHVWPWFLPMLDEAPAAVDAIGTFIQSHTR